LTSQGLHKEFGQPLNVVVILKTKLSKVPGEAGTGERAHVLLFSSDLSLAADKLIDYYSLRFQIEFTFRDAKQFWGLEDFMNVAETPIHPWLAKDCQPVAFHGDLVQGAHHSPRQWPTQLECARPQGPSLASQGPRSTRWQQ
jgi:hypothetical protein